MVLFSRRLPSLVRVPASLVPRSQRYYEGATTSHPRISGRLLVSLPPPTRSLLLRVRSRAPATVEVSSGPGFWWCRLPQSPALARGREWDLSGLQAIHPVPLLRSSTPVEPMCPRHLGHIDAAHALRTAKASAIAISGLVHAASAPADLRFAFRVATHAQGSLPAGWLAFAGRASNPLDRYERFQFVLTIILLSCPPDASAISVAHCAASVRKAGDVPTPRRACSRCSGAMRSAYCALRAIG
jgi:hypothetical protein